MPRWARDVAEIQCDDHRPAQPQQFQRQPQSQPEVGGVHHIDDDVRSFLTLEAAQRHITRDGFVQRGRRKTVGTWQVEHAIAAAGSGIGALAFLALHGDARVVGDMLAAARQPVEQRRLAAVGHTNKRHAQSRLGSNGAHACLHGDHDGVRLAPAQRKAAAADPHGNRVTAGARLGNDLEALTRHEADLDQPHQHGGAGLVVQHGAVFAYFRDAAARTHMQFGQGAER